MRRAIALSVWLACSCLGGVAAAQPRDPAAAEALFRAGLEALDRGDWPQACAKFDASMQLDPSAGTSINVARCLEHDGKLARAWAELQRAQVLAREAPEQRRRELEEFVRAEVARLEPRLPRLRILGADLPPGTEVTRDGIPIAQAVLGEALPADPGSHVVEATAPGFLPGRWEVVATEGGIAELTVTLERDPSAGAARGGAEGPDRAPGDEPSRVLPITGIVLLGLGIGGVAIGTVTGANALGAQNDIDAIGCDHDTQRCPDEESRAFAQATADRGSDLAEVSTIAFVSGGLLLGAGGTLLVIHALSRGDAAPSAAVAAPSRRVALEPMVGPQGGGLWLDGSF
jgi:hypothetical protein